MSEERVLQDVANKLDERDLVIDGLHMLHESSGSIVDDLRTYADNHLGADTLLTKSELVRYQQLQQLDSSANDQDTDHGSPSLQHNERDYQDAIQYLESATQFVANQIKVLHAQNVILTQSTKASAVDGKSSEKGVRGLQDVVWARELQDIRLANASLSSVLTREAKALEQELSIRDDTFRRRIALTMADDDEALNRMHAVSTCLFSETESDLEDLELIKDRCARLAKLTIKAAQCHLNLVFLDAFKDHLTEHHNLPNTSDTTHRMLEHEVETLYSEIPAVSQLSIAQQFLQPACKITVIRDKENQDHRDNVVSALAVDFAALRCRVQEMELRLAQHRNMHASAVYLCNEAEDLQRPTTSVHPTDDVAQPQSHLQSPPTESQPGSSRTSSTFSSNTETFSSLRTLHHSDASLHVHAVDPGDIAGTSTATVREMAIRLKSQEQELGKFENHTLTSLFSDCRHGLDALCRSSISTQYRVLQNANEEGLALLGAEIEEGQRCLGTIDVAALERKNQARDDLIRRWCTS